MVVDFTNNAAAILRAFAKYRQGTPFEPEEPDPELCTKLYAEILAAGVFTQQDADNFVKLAADRAPMREVQYADQRPADSLPGEDLTHWKSARLSSICWPGS